MSLNLQQYRDPTKKVCFLRPHFDLFDLKTSTPTWSYWTGGTGTGASHPLPGAIIQALFGPSRTTRVADVSEPQG